MTAPHYVDMEIWRGVAELTDPDVVSRRRDVYVKTSQELESLLVD